MASRFLPRRSAASPLREVTPHKSRELELLKPASHRDASREATYVAARVVLAVVFVGSALAKALAWEAGTSVTASVVFWLSIALEVGCGGLLAVGLYARKAALLLLLWVAVGIVFFHGDLSMEVNRVFTLANLGIAGGLLALTAHGGGLLSLDRWRAARAAASGPTP